jgi:hypothetical protein
MNGDNLTALAIGNLVARQAAGDGVVDQDSVARASLVSFLAGMPAGPVFAKLIATPPETETRDPGTTGGGRSGPEGEASPPLATPAAAPAIGQAEISQIATAATAVGIAATDGASALARIAAAFEPPPGGRSNLLAGLQQGEPAADVQSPPSGARRRPPGSGTE